MAAKNPWKFDPKDSPWAVPNPHNKAPAAKKPDKSWDSEDNPKRASEKHQSFLDGLEGKFRKK